MRPLSERLADCCYRLLWIIVATSIILGGLGLLLPRLPQPGTDARCRCYLERGCCECLHTKEESR